MITSLKSTLLVSRPTTFRGRSLPPRSNVSHAKESTSSESPSQDAEARAELLEARARRSKKGEEKVLQKQAYEKAVAESRKPMNVPTGGAEWDEKSLLPEGWEQMDQDRRLKELAWGKRGALFWLTQLAWYGSITLAVVWILFRFVGPAIGLYKLAGNIGDASL